MNRDYLAEFRSNCYEQQRTKFLDETSRTLQEQLEVFVPRFISDMEHIIAALIRLQQQIPVEIGWMQISLLASSVYLKTPTFRVEVFDENGLFGKVLYSYNLDASWLFGGWDAFQQSLEQGRMNQYIQQYIRDEQIRVLMFENMEYLTLMAAVYLKYVLSYFDRMKDFEKLLCAETFTVSVGQYHDWQKILYRQDKEIDIFFNPQKKTLVFQKYEEKVFRDKVFEDLDLCSVRFLRCKFVRCRFERAKLNDAVFEQCLLHDVVMNQVTMFGISFMGCRIENVDFSGAEFWCRDPLSKEYYQQPEFIGCESEQQLPNLEVR